MLMGDTCTRNCAFCGVESGNPEELDKKEPANIASAVSQMGLKYIVLTSVTRDDLEDGGAAHFAETVRLIKKGQPGSKVECLIPDLKGDLSDLKTVIDSGLDVLNHNMETVKSKYKEVRPQADYKRSLKVLSSAKKIAPSLTTKSGFMLGLGEKLEDIIVLLKDLKDAGCDIVTIGQYLSPSKENIPVIKYYREEEFLDIKKTADAMGFKAVFSGIFVRSSYHAREILEKTKG